MTNLSEQYMGMSEAKAVKLPNVPFSLVSFSVNDDDKSNLANYITSKGKAFSIKMGKNLPATNSIRVKGTKVADLSDKQLKTIADETALWIETNGSQMMREGKKTSGLSGEYLGEKFVKGQHGKNTVFEFSTKDKGLYVESFNVSSDPKEVSYQALYDSGEAISEIETDLNKVMKLAMKAAEKEAKAAGKNHKHTFED